MVGKQIGDMLRLSHLIVIFEHFEFVEKTTEHRSSDEI